MFTEGDRRADARMGEVAGKTARPACAEGTKGCRMLRRATLGVALASLLCASACSGGGTAPSTGTSTSSASANGITQVTVAGSPVAEVDAGPYLFAAVASRANGSVMDVTTLATWTSSNTTVARFTSIGGVPGLYTYQRGTVTVTAAYGGRTGTIKVTVL